MSFREDVFWSCAEGLSERELFFFVFYLVQKLVVLNLVPFCRAKVAAETHFNAQAPFNLIAKTVCDVFISSASVHSRLHQCRVTKMRLLLSVPMERASRQQRNEQERQWHVW